MITRTIDLRSDTVTKPTPAMREAMMSAEVGDDVYREDPTLNELERVAAETMGHEAALFVPSGCQANLIAQLVHVRRGDEVICGEASHCIRYETGSGAAIAGVQYSVVPGDGRYTAEQARARIRKANFHTPGTGLLWLENTHNVGGGLVTSLEEVRAVSELAREVGIPLHIDGARVFNAATALGVSTREIASLADSISFCLSKGLGAPVGSLVCGSKDFIVAAHRFRKMLGGGMRQAGILAAAGLHALEHHVARLGDDHVNARRLAQALAETPGLSVDMDTVQTNIVMVDVEGGDAERLAAEARTRGVLFNSLDPGRVRLVTHLDIDAEDVELAIGAIREARLASA